MVWRIRQHQWLPFDHHAFTALAFADGQACLPIKSINLLVIHLSTLTTQQLVDAPVPEPTTFERNGFDALCQLTLLWRALRLIAHRCAG
ncbi:hypothetical protein MSNKSG1_16766 [Marinobacter santoriniensis NKSG1]|uniref:Uncharacterized protein n=1 Tax=Marinobacter santoriniensis NKSG1 TaxID=1288826 RepID=M7CQ98_9GAMM|nr:hypothetical protein MSNKSG1_16766 [Marinobacter santoriniensis NKSG1]